MLRSGTKSWIMGHSDWICQGDSGTHEQAYSDFERMDKEGGLPSILICDLNFYGENTGFEFMEKIHELYPSVANQLNIKKRAVENYISVIYEKTGVNDRAELVLKYGQ
ncbi:MAG: hypothetical protein J6Y60_08430 [Treponema sp.]|nr:hypothetical protein [Treponema sp.]